MPFELGDGTVEVRPARGGRLSDLNVPHIAITPLAALKQAVRGRDPGELGPAGEVAVFRAADVIPAVLADVERLAAGVEATGPARALPVAAHVINRRAAAL